MLRRLFALSLIALFLLACSAQSFMSLWSPPPVQDSEAAETVLTGNVERGESIFKMGVEGAPACANCHSTLLAGGSAGFAFGPSLIGLSERAGTRVEGLSVEAYIHESIVSPARYLVPGFRNMMFSDYAEYLSEQDIADLTAYVLTF